MKSIQTPLVQNSLSYSDCVDAKSLWTPGKPRGLKPAARYTITHFALVLTILSLTNSTSSAGWYGENQQDSWTPPPASSTQLRLAWSRDGLRFKDMGEVFIQGASAPDLITLPNGTMIALFDYANSSSNESHTILAVSQSRDGGRQWSSAKPINIKGLKGTSLNPRHGDLVLTPGGLLRLYFSVDCSSKTQTDTQRETNSVFIRSAVSKNGRDYRLDWATRVEIDAVTDVHPAVVRFRERFYIYMGGMQGDALTGKQRGMKVPHHVSSDGRWFAKLKQVDLSETSFLGSMVSLPRKVRAYTSSPKGILSYVTSDGRRWKKEPGSRLKHGWDPAVTRLSNGTFLMLYCAPIVDATLASSQIVEDMTNDFLGEVTNLPSTTDDEDVWSNDLAVVDADNPNDWIPVEEGVEDDMDDGALDPEEWQLQQERSTSAGLENYDPVTRGGFAPRPNFKDHINYIEWYKRYAQKQTDDNAYDVYATFMPGRDNLSLDGKPWPKLTNMFKDDSYDGTPAPWDPQSHPEWEKSHEIAKPLHEKFREAATHEGYTSPPNLYNDSDAVDTEEDQLLINILLPSLSSHRDMVKQTLADAWRKDAQGKVSSQGMLEAWRTSLRGASHIAQGATLIEELVGLAERALVQKNARWALKQDIFSPDELEDALNTLQQLDRDDRDPALSLRGEHGFSMDVTQYLFTPPTPDGKPQINLDHAQKIIDFSGDSDISIEDFEGMTEADAQATLDTFDTYYHELGELMRVGYPEVRTPDVYDLEQQYINATPLTRAFMPSLSRYYTLKARAETSRRATQLAYATHLFKARNGRFPDSLDELPPEHGERMRIDPYSGEYFRYRLTENGPRIYSVSENGVDDDGVHSWRWEDTAEENNGSDDHVFWPPQPRK